jgi:tetratricopeptide (TPR) repeat protein
MEEKLNNSDNSQNSNYLEKLIIWMDSICVQRIVDTSQHDFDLLLNKMDRSYYIGDELSTFSDTAHQNLLNIRLTELKFKAFVAIQHSLERCYNQLEMNRKFSNTIVYATTNSSISELKTNLVHKQIGLLSNLRSKDLKRRCWLAISRMLDEIDIKSSETGAQVVQRSPYGIITYEGELYNRLLQLIQETIDPEIRGFADSIINHVYSAPTKYKAFKSEIEIMDLSELSGNKSISQKALEYFNNAIDHPDNREKIILYSKAIEEDSSFTSAFNNRGICYFEINEYEKAKDDFEYVLQLDPYKIIVFSYIGNCFLRLRDFEQAIIHYSRAVQYGINSTTIYINRGLCYYHLKKYSMAIDDFSKAVNIDSSLTNAYNNRVLCYLAINDNAIKDYHKLTELDSLNSTNFYNLGCVYWGKKEWKNVIKSWEKGIKVNPNDIHILDGFTKIRKNLNKD